MCREPLHRPARNEFEPLLTPQEASAYLRVHSKTVVKLARERTIPALRIGKHWRLRASDLVAWAEGRIQSSGQPVE
jgi:PTS system nitrogen regulatory IIA component